MKLAKNVVEDVALVLFVVALLFLASAKAQADKTTVPANPARTLADKGSIVEKLPVSYSPDLYYMQVGTYKVPCVKLTIKYEDGTSDEWKGECSTDGRWGKILAALGKEMDAVADEHDRILKLRGKR